MVRKDRLHCQFLVVLVIIGCLSFLLLMQHAVPGHNRDAGKSEILEQLVEMAERGPEMNIEVNDTISFMNEADHNRVANSEKYKINPQIQEGRTEQIVIHPPYLSVTGFRRAKKGFLTIGIPSVKRKNGQVYLIHTLNSVIKETSEKEKKDIVVMVFLADFDRQYNRHVTDVISDKYKDHLMSGFLQVVEIAEEFYPPLDNLKRNFADAPERVKWRSKQNIDFAFMFIYGHNISRYYIQIEDDVICAPKFISGIKDYITKFDPNHWTALEFSNLGFIGKLFRSEDVLVLGQYLILFYDEQPCDWLIRHFISSMGQKSRLIRKPTLFQHEGLVSSLLEKSQKGFNKLKDTSFGGKDIPAILSKEPNPPAIFETNMMEIDNCTLENAYSDNENFFWTRTRPGGYILIRFKKPHRIHAIAVQTGNEKHNNDFLRSGVVEFGHINVTDSPELNEGIPKECGRFEEVGKFDSSLFYWEELDENEPAFYTTACVRIRITKVQRQWLLVERIQIVVSNQEKKALPVKAKSL